MQSLTRSMRPSAAPSGSSWICQSCRQQSTSARTRRALRVRPDPSFAPSTTQKQDHIILNPPSSAPNVYQTPLKFLPSSDPRRQLFAQKSSSTTSAITLTSSTTQKSTLPPPLRSVSEKNYHVTEEQITEIQKLRKEDPRQWTRVRLAEQFGCSQFFVSLCCAENGSPEIKAEREKELERIKQKWGRRKREAREERLERKKLWGRDA